MLANALREPYTPVMASQGSTIERIPETPHSARRREQVKVRSPAAPIAQGMGLDQPFFDDKNRAFWILQLLTTQLLWIKAGLEPLFVFLVVCSGLCSGFGKEAP